MQTASSAQPATVVLKTTNSFSKSNSSFLSMMRITNADSEDLRTFAFLQRSWRSQSPRQCIYALASIMPASFMFGMFQLLYSILNTNAYVLLKLIGDEDLTVAFGLARSFVLTVYESLCQSNAEVFVVLAARFFGAGKPEMVRIARTNCYAMFIFLTSIYWILVYFFYGKLLSLIHVKAHIIELSQRVMLMYFPYMLLCQFNSLLGMMLISLGVDTQSYPFLLLSLLIAIGIMYLLHYYFFLGLWSFFIAASAFELFNLFLFLHMYWTKVDPRYKGVASLKASVKYLGAYILNFFAFLFAYITEIAGWEVMLYFALLTRDNYNILSVQFVMNIATYIIFFSNGYSSKAVAVIGVLIGGKLKKAAKRFSVLYFVEVLLIGITVGAIIFFSAPWITRIFVVETHQPELYRMVLNLIKNYAFWVPQDLLIKWIMYMARTLSLSWLAFTLTVIFPIICQFLLCYYFYHSSQGLSAPLVLNTSYSMYSIVTITLLIVYATMDWEKIQYIPSEYLIEDNDGGIMLEENRGGDRVE